MKMRYNQQIEQPHTFIHMNPYESVCACAFLFGVICGSHALLLNKLLNKPLVVYRFAGKVMK